MSGNKIKKIMNEADSLLAYKNQRNWAKDRIFNKITSNSVTETKSNTFFAIRIKNFAFLSFASVILVFLAINLINLYNIDQEIRYVDSVIAELEVNNSVVENADFEIDSSVLEY